MGVYEPDQFAALAAYNSMLNALFAHDFYIRNIVNRPTYIVHSDLDNLRRIQVTRTIVDSLSRIDDKLNYKEYIGYQHEDKHIDKDIPFALTFLNSQSRSPFRSHIYWETTIGSMYNTCDWLAITGIDTSINAAKWFKQLNFFYYDIANKQWMKNFPVYADLQKSATIKASYLNNTFNIEASRTTEVEIKISPVMINLEEPVIVNINGKKVFESKITADKAFLLNGFQYTFDRQALWVNSIKLKISN
jgi:hypothetical protein